MATIACFEVTPVEQRYFKRHFAKDKLLFFKEPLGEQHLPKIRQAQAVCVFIYSQVTKKIIDELPKLKIIATRSTGFDHIDLAASKKRGVHVTNVPTYGENTVAEHAFGLLLSLSRKIPQSYQKVQEHKTKQGIMTGSDLRGKTIGIIGGGHIGMHLARMARGFSMQVKVFDIRHDPILADAIGFTYTDMDELITTSDVISLHTPHNKATHHLMGKQQFSKIKRGAILINTARGPIVDTQALLEALENRRLGGAGLDVIEDEQLLLDPPAGTNKAYERNMRIINRPNVIYTPHNAFNSKEAIQRILQTTSDNIREGLKTTPRNSL